MKIPFDVLYIFILRKYCLYRIAKKKTTKYLYTAIKLNIYFKFSIIFIFKFKNNLIYNILF